MAARPTGRVQPGPVCARLDRWLRDSPRRTPWPHSRLLRTAQILAFAALYADPVYGVAAELLVPSLIAMLATGRALMGFEVYQTRLWLVQLRGIATFAKLVLVAGVAIFWDFRLPLLTLVVAIGVVTSHMPGRDRCNSLLHRREVRERGAG